MSIRKFAVHVCQAPSEISSRSHIEFLSRLEMSAESGDRRFVLDCSKLERLGPAEIRFLLCCLEEVMKNNGDMRLAMVHPDLKIELRRVGMNRLFEMYETTEGAVHSYQLNPVSSGSPSSPATNEEQANEYAA